MNFWEWRGKDSRHKNKHEYDMSMINLFSYPNKLLSNLKFKKLKLKFEMMLLRFVSSKKHYCFLSIIILSCSPKNEWLHFLEIRFEIGNVLDFWFHFFTSQIHWPTTSTHKPTSDFWRLSLHTGVKWLKSKWPLKLLLSDFKPQTILQFHPN